MDNDNVAAAVLAAALIKDERMSYAADVSITAFAVKVYFDCLDAIHAEKLRRGQAQSESSRT